jgi:uncharacterized membrane protein YphA (DoxX/SURF4 family)
MKLLIHLLRFLVGGLFIFSGLVKANDPLGLTYKMEEFFEIWHTIWMIPFGTTLSVSMNALEIVAGVALWVGWKPKWTLGGLLVLILFFTGLTGYTYYTGYPKTCGCFGDCLPIAASVSFYKDVALLFGIGLLIWKQAWIQPIFSNRYQRVCLLAAAIFSVGLEFYVLHHLPIVDCLPYQVGKSIIEQRKQPPPPSGSTVMFVYKKNGKEIEFAADQFPLDFNAQTYQFVRRYDTGEIIQAPIQGFVLYGMGGTDTTDAVLETDRVMMIFSERIQDDPKNWGASFNALYQLAKSQKIPLLLITNRPDLWTLERKRSYPEIILLSCDRTPIRTAARVTPTLFELKRGSIQGKWALSDWSIERSSFNTSR